MNAVDIQARRRLVFRYQSLGLTPREMQPLINELYPVSVETVRRDIRNMGDWLSGLLSVEEGEADKSLARIMGLLHMAQRRLVQLMYYADNDSARVGAAKGLADMVTKEADLRMDLGRLPRVPVGLRVEEAAPPYDLEALLDRAIEAEDKRRGIVLKDNL